MRFADKVVVVTGAARGQGRESARAFAAEGASLAVTDMLGDDLRETVRLIESAGGQAVSVAGDLTNPSTIDSLVEAATARFGGIDVLHNNAGVLIGGTLEETDVAEFERAFRINVVTHSQELKHYVQSPETLSCRVEGVSTGTSWPDPRTVEHSHPWIESGLLSTPRCKPHSKRRPSRKALR